MATELEIRMRLGEQRAAYEDVLQGPYLVVGYANASAQHQQLFAEYVVALRQAKAEAESWWQDLIDVETDSIGDPKEALTNVRMRRPAGSVAFGAVVHALRGAWVGCAGLNQSLGQAAANSPRVEPFELVFDWLLEHRHFDLLEYLGGLPFLPVGIDQRGEWL